MSPTHSQPLIKRSPGEEEIKEISEEEEGLIQTFNSNQPDVILVDNKAISLASATGPEETSEEETSEEDSGEDSGANQGHPEDR